MLVRIPSITLVLSIFLILAVPVLPAQIEEPRSICVMYCPVVTGPIIRDVQAERLQQLSNRYQQIWRRLRSEGIDSIDGLSLSQVPASEAPLVSITDRLYGFA